MKQIINTLFWLVIVSCPTAFNFSSSGSHGIFNKKERNNIRKEEVIDYQLGIDKAEKVFFDDGENTTLTPARFVPILADRECVMLNGSWQVTYWPFPQGVEKLVEDPGQAIWKNIIQPGKIFYYDPEQNPGTIPEWDRVTQNHLDPDDGAIIRREVTIPAKWKGKLIKLRFEGLYPAGEIYWDGKLVGEQWSGLTPVEIDLTGLAEPATTYQLAVRFYRRHDAIQLDMPRHALDFVGLSRSAYVHAVEPVHIADIYIRPELAGDYITGTMSGKVLVRNETDRESEVKLNMRVIDASGNVVTCHNFTVSITRGSAIPVPFSFPVGQMKVWNDEQPYLYNFALQLLSVDQPSQIVTRRIGFRRFEMKGQRPLLNGNPVKFRGVNHLTFHPDGGLYTPEQWLRQCLALMKRANVNAIRTHFYSPPELVDLCDEMGFYLLQELPIDWGTHYVQKTSLLGPMLHRMEAGVRRDRNHPSVMVWCIGNENMPFKEEVYDSFMQHLHLCEEMVKHLDPGRPTMFPPPGPAGRIKGIFEARMGDIADTHYSFELVREFNKTDVVTNPRTWTPTFETHTREELLKGGWSGVWFSSEYGITDLRSDPLNAPYISIISDVPEDPLSGKNSQQVFIDRLNREWGYMRDDTTCLGGAYFCWIAPGAGDPWGWMRWGEDADWGVVTSDLVPKPAFWAMRSIFSPVQISDSVTWKQGQTEIKVRVFNGYNSIDLSQCTLRTQWGMPQTLIWQDIPVSCPPGRNTVVTIPVSRGSLRILRVGNPAVCRCTILDPEGYRPVMNDVLVIPGKTAAIDTTVTFAYYPDLRKLEVRISGLVPEALGGHHEVTALVRQQGSDHTVLQQRFTVTGKGGSCIMDMPKLEDGIYELAVFVRDLDLNVVRSFRHKNFPWLGNHLGKKDMIYPPYKPVRVKDDEVEIVLRTYEMNGFGLWNSVKSQGKEILAAPITLHLVTDKGKGEETWLFEKGKWSSLTDVSAVYKAQAMSRPVQVRSTSTIEYDGCMKVEMELLPGENKETIRMLWLEIPLKDSEVPLFHYTAFESMRRNYAGKTPRGGKIIWVSQPYDTDPPRWPRGALPPLWKAEPGSDDGILWTCRDIRPWKHVISTDFVPYIWLGGGERGLAFFGANDKGYMVDPEGTIQIIERKNDIVYLRIYLVNKPSVVDEPRKITFGIQAGPTRPMPDNWRLKQRVTMAMPGPVLCWGGYICANKYPEGNNWQIVEEINRVRETGIIDSSVFIKLDQNRSESWKKPWGGTGRPGFDKWLARDMWYFINRAKSYYDRSDWSKIATEGIFSKADAKVLANPSWVVYTEEHASDVTEPEWEVFQDEWRAEWPWMKPRNEITGHQQPVNNFDYGRQAYPESYLDFCLYYHNEWFKRGEGVYFDNTMPYTMYNPLLSDAYFDEHGNLQPACSIWEQRNYYKRVWLRMNEIEKSGVPYPLVFAQHITNTRLLPWNTWCTITLDIEWDWYRDTTIVISPIEESAGIEGEERNSRRRRLWIPIPPDLLLAETVGRQTGTMGDSHFNILGRVNFLSGVPETYRLSEWGMRAVHEFKLHGAEVANAALWKFGYGTDLTKVVNYWSDNPPVNVNDPDNNKWLLVIRNSDQSLFLVLQTWNKQDTEVVVTLNPSSLGFTPAAHARDVITGTELPCNGNSLKLLLPGPYGTRVISIGTKQ